MRTPGEVRIREEAACKESQKCSMMPRKKRMKRKPSTELYVNGNFTEDREEWKQELQRHCEEVFMDPKKQKEVQEEGSRKPRREETSNSRRMGEELRSQSTGSCRPVPRCRVTASMDQKAAVVSERIKQLPQEKFYIITRCFPGTYHGSDGSTKFMEDRAGPLR